MNNVNEIFKMYNQATAQQKKLAKIRAKFCGSDEPRRSEILAMERRLRCYRKSLCVYLKTNVGTLFSAEEPVIPDD